ncbi:recombinase family protein [Haladaptatus sp. F3-133]|uniref:Recombinase family protein n=1 Tax=Halorutilus salinus TaxID=2487751 RepID=A0A9Q4GK28_9EURY|nr:recombinase family protein [Halorutilus salinus]MCX2819786.1 recombinase family protein [Halorutilus salinus]
MEIERKKSELPERIGKLNNQIENASLTLYSSYVQCMIWALYGGQIIHSDISAVLKSLSTAFKSYIRTSPKSYTAIDGSSENNSTLNDFSSSPEEQTKRESKVRTNGRSKKTEEKQETDYSAAHGYARQSKTDEESEGEESASINSQKRNIHLCADEHGLEVENIYVDKNESGFSFNRPGLDELREEVEKNPQPVILDRADRFGRETLETLYVAAKLHYHHEVPIITDSYGKYELDKMSDQMQLAVRAIVAGESVKARIRAAWDAIETIFTESESWYTWFNKIPVAFKQKNEWIQKTEYGKEVISAIMEDFLETKNYSAVADLVKKSAKNKKLDNKADGKFETVGLEDERIRSVFEESDYEISELTGQKIKSIITNPVYVGKIRYPRSADEDEQKVMEVPELGFDGKDFEELFDEVDRVVEEIYEKNSLSQDTVDLEELSEKGLLLKAVDETDVVDVVCQECGSPMTKNGTGKIDGGTEVHYWMCPDYSGESEESRKHTHRKFPKERNGEWDDLKEHLNKEYPQYSDVVILRMCEI